MGTVLGMARHALGMLCVAVCLRQRFCTRMDAYNTELILQLAMDHT